MGQQRGRKKMKVRPRFFSMILIMMMGFLSVYFIRHRSQDRLPNLHGWASADVLAFAEANGIEITFEFVYSDIVSPTLVSRQHVQPGTAIDDGMVVAVEVSKGIEVSR